MLLDWCAKSFIQTTMFCRPMALTYKPVDNLASVCMVTLKAFLVDLRFLSTKDVYYTNENQIMEPVKSKQNEIGVKYQNAGVMTTLSYFDIDEANRYDIFNADGEILYQS